MLSVSIVGLGRVGGALAITLPKDRYTVAQLVYRSDRFCDAVLSRLGGEAVATPITQLERISSDLVIITTQDFEIKNVVSALNGKIANAKAIFQTSGSRPSTVLSPLSGGHTAIGSIHPLVSVPRPEMGPERFHGAYFCVEGEPAADRLGRDLVTALGGQPFSIDTKYKTLYHAAAVTACGHLVALFDAAVEMMTKCGLSDVESKSILLPLVASTVTNLGSESNASALTGTFARADSETLVSHLKALNENVSDELLEIYLLLGERSLELATKQGVNSERIEMMKAKVSIAKSKLKW